MRFKVRTMLKSQLNNPQAKGPINEIDAVFDLSDLLSDIYCCLCFNDLDIMMLK